LKKIMDGEPRSGRFHSHLLRGVEFTPLETLETVASVQDAMDRLRLENETVWLATALYATTEGELSDLDRARVVEQPLPAYRRLVKMGLAWLAGIIGGGCC
jgi:hypothetical protein